MNSVQVLGLLFIVLLVLAVGLYLRKLAREIDVNQTPDDALARDCRAELDDHTMVVGRTTKPV